MTKKLWLDLELREDIDDALTLVYVLENKYQVNVVSVNNPSVLELQIIQGLKCIFGAEYDIVYSGEITSYEEGKDVNQSLLHYIDITDSTATCINDYSINGEYDVFCGGSLTTLAYLMYKHGAENIQAYVQGGYASYEIVPEHAVLKKFKKRKQVPSWNLGLDMDATKDVLASDMSIKFISKNICHSAHVGVNDTNKKTLFSKILFDYLREVGYKTKCLHDVLAFLSIKHDFIDFLNVDLN